MLVQPLRYDTVADVARRLNGTFVRYKGEAVLVAECYDNLTVDVVFVGRKNYKDTALFRKNVHSSDVELDIESPELGWTFIKWGSTERPIYFLRTIHRQFSQGIDPNRVMVFDPCQPDDDMPVGLGGSNSFADYGPFARMIDGDVHACLDEAMKTPTGLPLNKRWAVVNVVWDKRNLLPSTYTIFHGWNAIGTFHPKTQRLFFAKGHLTKTRRIELAELLSRDPKGYQYAVEEQS